MSKIYQVKDGQVGREIHPKKSFIYGDQRMLASQAIVRGIAHLAGHYPSNDPGPKPERDPLLHHRVQETKVFDEDQGAVVRGHAMDSKTLEEVKATKKQALQTLVDQKEENGILVIDTPNISQLVVRTSSGVASRLQRAESFLGRNTGRSKREKVKDIHGNDRHVNLKKADIHAAQNAIGEYMILIGEMHEALDADIDACKTQQSAASVSFDTIIAIGGEL